MKNYKKFGAGACMLILSWEMGKPFILHKGEYQSELQEKAPFIYIAQNGQNTSISGVVGSTSAYVQDLK
jgi:hypothetical protein